MFEPGITTDERAYDPAICALADALGGRDEVLVTPIGPIAEVAARLARATTAPEIMLSDRSGRMVTYRASDQRAVVESYLPFRGVFDIAWSGRRHVIMGASGLHVERRRHLRPGQRSLRAR